jgi:hypothetical protein
LLFNGRFLTTEHLETINLENASDFYLKNVPNKREGFDLEIEVQIPKDDKTNTAYSLRKKITSNLPNTDYFKEYFEIIDLDSSDNIWKLFTCVPNNRQIRKEILGIPETKNIVRYVDLSKPKKTLYYMNSLYKILSNNKEPEFNVMLAQSKQIDELASLIIKTETLETKSLRLLSTIIKGIFPIIDFMIMKGDTYFKFDEKLEAGYFKSVLSMLKFLLSSENTTIPSANIEKLVEDALLHFENILIKFDSLDFNDANLVVWTDLYMESLVLNNDNTIKKLFSKTFEACMLKKEIRENAFIQILTPLYTETLQKVYKEVTRAVYYFEMASSIIKKCEADQRSIQLIALLDFKTIWEHLLPTILKTNDEKLMVGLLRFLTSSLLNKPDLDEWAIVNKDVLIKLISICLIDQTGKQRLKPVCQGAVSRASFFEFMKTVTLVAPSTRSPVYSYFLSIINKGKWRKRYYKDWNIELPSLDVKLGQYSGLYNLGATCYMNSIFQQIFMLEEFRNFLIDAEVEVDKDFQQNVMFQVAYPYLVPNGHERTQRCCKNEL